MSNIFLLNVKYFGIKIRIQFNNTPLVIEQINYPSKIVNVALKTCLFVATNIVKNSD